MRKITIPTAPGQHLNVRLPEGWHEVPFGPYFDLAATAQEVPAIITHPTAHVYASVAGCHALAHLLKLPTEVLNEDVSRLVPIYEAAPWLFRHELPAPHELVTAFTHQGIRYRFAGRAELGEAAAAGRERLLHWYLREADGNPAAVITELLATLYTPGGATPTFANNQAGIEAFKSLPMSIVWPLLLHFLPEPMPADVLSRCLLLRPMAAQALAALEHALATAPTTTTAPVLAPFRALLRWLGWAWRN